MRFAERDNSRILPDPINKQALCPACKAEVISKCGDINIWHWAHKNNEDCDNWGGRETEWHINWKNEFPNNNQEVIVGNHRADVKINNTVIEFQNSFISAEDIRERELFYGKMIWVLNLETLCNRIKLKVKNNYSTFRWKYPKKSWENSERPIYIDIGITPMGDGISSHKLFLIKKIYFGKYVGGWGKLISKKDFIMEHSK